MTKLVEIEGIGPSYAKALQGAGIDTIEELLERGGTPAGRQGIADKSGLSPKLVLEWVNHADLMRIKGVGSEYADLLEAAASTPSPSWPSATPPAWPRSSRPPTRPRTSSAGCRPKPRSRPG